MSELEYNDLTEEKTFEQFQDETKATIRKEIVERKKTASDTPLFYAIFLMIVFPIFKHFWMKQATNNVIVYWVLIGLSFAMSSAFFMNETLSQREIKFNIPLIVFFLISGCWLIILHVYDNSKSLRKKISLHLMSIVCISFALILSYFLKFWTVFSNEIVNKLSVIWITVVTPIFIFILSLVFLFLKDVSALVKMIIVALGVSLFLNYGLLIQNITSVFVVVILAQIILFIAWVALEQAQPHKKTKQKKILIIISSVVMGFIVIASS